MLYDNYEKKIIKRAKIKKLIFRFRIPIFAVTFTAISAGGTILGTKGLVNDTQKLKNAYIYGEQYRYSSSAFLSSVDYEFADYDSEEWNKEAPTLVGKYKMRSKGKNSFSSYYYGKDQFFEIIPKDIVVTTKEDSLTYGEIPTIDISKELVFGDYLDDGYTVSYSDKTLETWGITPNLETLKIYSSEGKDVTSCYNLKVKTKDVEILKKSISVSTGSTSKVYDGKSLSNGDFEIVQGSLVEGDSISLANKKEITNAQTVDNEQSYLITNGDGLDMTIHYAINLVPGTLDIKPQPITFTSTDYEYTYDGEDHRFSLDDVNYDEDDIIGKQKVTLSYDNEDDIVAAGEYSNSFKAKILDGKVDVTSNYDITYEFGKTTINTRKISIRSNSETKTYDNKALSNSGYKITLGTLASKDEVTVISAPEYTESGEYENDVTYAIVDKETGDDFTSSYEIDYTKGTLTVEPVELTISIIPQEIVYDGKPHQNEYVLSSGSLVGTDYLKVKTNEEKTEAGVYDNDSFEVDVLKLDKTLNNDNYNITYEGREEALKILKREIAITSISKEKLYDGISLRSGLTQGENVFKISSGSLATSEYIRFFYLNDAVNAGVTPIQSEIKIYHLTGQNEDPEVDIDVTSNYDITYFNGNYTINKRNITIKTIDASHPYNRDPSIPDSISVVGVENVGDGIAPNQTVSNFGVSCDGIEVGVYSYDADPELLKIVDANDNDVTSNYNITFINSGKLTITKREINVTMLENSKIYDGTPFSSDKHSVTNLLEGDYLVFDGLPSVKHVNDGHVTNDPGSVQVLMSDTTDVSSNYHVNYVNNESIYIEPRPIEFKSADITKTFNGLPIDVNDEVIIKDLNDTTNLGLADGDSFEVVSLESRDNVEDYVHVSQMPRNNIFVVKITNSEDEDVTSDYDINYDYGKITIKPCPIKLGVYEHDVVYDGVSHGFTFNEAEFTTTSHDIYIKEGTVPENYHIGGSVTIENMLDAGFYDEYETNFIVDYSTAPYGYVEGDFKITIPSSNQTISKRPITISTLAGSKIYDGNKFGYGLDDEDMFWISYGSLAEGHTINSYELEELVDVGVYNHIIQKIIIHDANGNDVTKNYAINYLYGQVTIYEE